MLDHAVKVVVGIGSTPPIIKKAWSRLWTALDAAKEVFRVAVEVFAEVAATGEQGTGGAVGVGAAPGLGRVGRAQRDGDAVCVEGVGGLGVRLRLRLGVGGDGGVDELWG